MARGGAGPARQPKPFDLTAAAGAGKLARMVSRTPAEWTVVPDSPAEIDRVAAWCRRRVNQRALFAAGVAVVPLPGIDWITDVGLLMRLLPEINQAFGLMPEQVERLAPNRRIYAYKAISAAGGMVVGRIVTRELIVTLLRIAGVRLTAQQAAKYVPIAGQAVSAALTFSALKLVCEQHIRQCIEVAQLLGRLPAPLEMVEEVEPA